MEDRLEMAGLRANPTKALWTLRCKWEQQRSLSRAEWMLVAQYVQFGCEELGEDPELPTNESLAQVLEAFLSVRALRIERGVELDRYYLGNFRCQ